MSLSRSVEVLQHFWILSEMQCFPYVCGNKALCVFSDGNAGVHRENRRNDEERRTLCFPRWPYYPFAGKCTHFINLDANVLHCMTVCCTRR